MRHYLLTFVLNNPDNSCVYLINQLQANGELCQYINVICKVRGCVPAHCQTADRLTTGAWATEINSKSWQGLFCNTTQGKLTLPAVVILKAHKEKVCLFSR